jgi:hypothetical protein
MQTGQGCNLAFRKLDVVRGIEYLGGSPTLMQAPAKPAAPLAIETGSMIGPFPTTQVVFDYAIESGHK